MNDWVRISRNYSGTQINFDVKVTKHPVWDHERFLGPAMEATHSYERLLDLLTQAIGSREQAVEALSEAMAGGDGVELRLLPQATVDLRNALGTSSV